MKIWEYVPNADVFKSVHFVDQERHWDIVQGFNGTSLTASWTPLLIQGYEDGIIGSFPSFPGSMPPVFTGRALRLLNPLIAESIEALPLVWRGYETLPIYAINVVEVVDCLDQTHSVIERFADGRVMYVRNHVFKDECLEGKHIFKLPELRTTHVYLSDRFRITVEEYGLRGLIFRQLK